MHLHREKLDCNHNLKPEKMSCCHFLSLFRLMAEASFVFDLIISVNLYYDDEGNAHIQRKHTLLACCSLSLFRSVL